MRRTVILIVAATAALIAGCSDSGEDLDASPAPSSASSAASSSSTPSAAATSAPAPAGLGEVDVYTCQSFVADAGDAYGWLTTLERNGTISGDLSTPGYLEVYQLGGTASVYSDQVESPRLSAAMRVTQREGEALKAEIDSQGSVTPTPLRQALDNAAAICEDDGFVIDWNA
jgi:hypothetical protein